MELKAILNKPYTEEQRTEFIVEQNHRFGYEIKETEIALEAWGADDIEKLEQAKQSKIQENDTKRDEALNQGVEYKDVLFDSDTDQKVNLLAIVSTISDEDTIIWFGMDNQPLVCNKQDLINIGGLITQLHNFCWNKNALIKAEINNAQATEEVEAIIIDYTIPTPEENSEVEESEGE
jgi:N-methylhydantoinase A/oxoprolinase/acetone carboxylase beta subunit